MRIYTVKESFLVAFFSVLSVEIVLFHICYMENVIFLKEVLEIMDLKMPNGDAVKFDIEVFTFNRNNKEGGKLKIYNDAKKCIAKVKNSTYKPSQLDKLMQVDKAKKNPNHFENRTRNIELPNGDIRTINILFIKKFNGQKVYY